MKRKQGKSCAKLWAKFNLLSLFFSSSCVWILNWAALVLTWYHLKKTSQKRGWPLRTKIKKSLRWHPKIKTTSKIQKDIQTVRKPHRMKMTLKKWSRPEKLKATSKNKYDIEHWAQPQKLKITSQNEDDLENEDDFKK